MRGVIERLERVTKVIFSKSRNLAGIIDLQIFF